MASKTALHRRGIEASGLLPELAISPRAAVESFPYRAGFQSLAEFSAGQVACSDTEIVRRFGVRRGTTRSELFGFDRQFAGADGRRLRDIVIRAARRADIHPALLAVNVLSEEDDRRVWLSPGRMENIRAGLDFWHEQRRRVARQVGVNLSTTIRRTPACRNIGLVPGEIVDAQGRCVFVNERTRTFPRGRPTGPVHVFASPTDAMTAMAGWLRVLETQLGQAVGASAWDAFPEPFRHAVTRYAYNPGPRPAMRLTRRAARSQAAGRDPIALLPRRGDGPQRRATIRAAQAMHLSNTVFGQSMPCP
jgi:hypothetical protein